MGKPGAIYGTALESIDFKRVIKSIVLQDFPILKFFSKNGNQSK